MNVGLVQMRNQSWNNAIAAAQDAIRCKPDLPKAHGNLGRALSQKEPATSDK
jgi:cytochrome c-type biogenesis protein CcmH/NrfG